MRPMFLILLGNAPQFAVNRSSAEIFVIDDANLRNSAPRDGYCRIPFAAHIVVGNDALLPETAAQRIRRFQSEELRGASQSIGKSAVTLQHQAGPGIVRAEERTAIDFIAAQNRKPEVLVEVNSRFAYGETIQDSQAVRKLMQGRGRGFVRL